jgi:hypothetical protein
MSRPPPGTVSNPSVHLAEMLYELVEHILHRQIRSARHARHHSKHAKSQYEYVPIRALHGAYQYCSREPS